MLGTLVRNIAISAVAFFAVSLVGLLLVPVLIRTYGLAGFGHIAVARIFLPVAALAFLDFGFGEIATQATAQARTDGNWQRAGALLTLTARSALLVGLLAGGLLAATSAWIPKWMGLPTADHAGLSQVLCVTAVMLPVLFMSLVLEGVVKGFERFDALRSIEVVAALSNAALALWAAWGGFDQNAVCYALLASLALRVMLAGGFAAVALRAKSCRVSRATVEDRVWFWARSRAMAANKALGTAQSQLPQLLVGLLLGPVSVGIFDALSRLPRAIKGVLGLLSSTVLPLATRLESAADDKRMRRLGRLGVLLVGLVSLPPLAASMVFSRPILQLWLGDALALLWGWQAALFLVPAMSVLVGFGAAALLVRPHVVRTMNWITVVQIVLQYGTAVLAVTWLQERAFFLGQVLAVSITFVAQMRLVHKEMDLPRATFVTLLRLVLLMTVLALPGLLLAARIHSWAGLAMAMAGWTVVCWLTCMRLVLTNAQRDRLVKLARARLGSGPKEYN